MKVVLEYSEEDIAHVDFMEHMIYDILGSLEVVELIALENKTELLQLKKKYGDSAFLMPEKCRYPIINPKTGKKDQALLHAAYIDLKRRSGITGTGDLAQKAKNLMDENSFVVEINSSEIPLVDYLELIE